MDDGTISTTSPSITGNLYSLYAGNVNFYDGVLKGKTEAYKEGAIASVANATNIDLSSEEIDGELYYTAYLVEERIIAKIGTVEYTSLLDAIEAATNDDTIVIVNDFIQYNPIIIDQNKTTVIDTNGKTIKINSTITNNGSLRMINSSSNKSTLNYYKTDYLFINKPTGNMLIEGAIISAQNGFKNEAGGSLSINNTILTSSKTAINNVGSLVMNNSDIIGDEYSIYIVGSGISTVDNSIITSGQNSIYNNETATIEFNNTETHGYIYNGNTNGTINFVGSNIERTTDSSAITLFLNKGKSSISSTVITLYDNNTKENYYSGNDIAIQNDGILDIKDNSEFMVSVNNSLKYKNRTMFGIYNNGTSVIEDSSINVDGNTYSTSYPSYGIYNNGGSSTIKTGSITTTGIVAYGIYVNTGSVTMGIPEDPSSPNYGGELANVSLINPVILADGLTTGIGVKNIGGHFKYYDGKIMGNTSAKPDVASDIEYLYEAIDYVDEETGYQYCILKWMRPTNG